MNPRACPYGEGRGKAPGGLRNGIVALALISALLPACAAVMTRSDYNIYAIPSAPKPTSAKPNRPRPAPQPKPPALKEQYSHRFDLTLLQKRLLSPAGNQNVRLAFEEMDGSGKKEFVAQTDGTLWILTPRGEVLRKFYTAMEGSWHWDNNDIRTRKFTWTTWSLADRPAGFQTNFLRALPTSVPFRKSHPDFSVRLIPALAAATTDNPIYFVYPESGRWLKEINRDGNVANSHNLLLPTWKPEVLMTDLDGDGRAETVFAAKDTGSLLCFGADGRLKWSRTFIGPFARMKAFDALGDGKRELILLTDTELLVFASDGALLRRFTVVGASHAGWREHALDITLAHTRQGPRILVAISSTRNEWGNKSIGGGKIRQFTGDGNFLSEFDYPFLGTASIATGNLTGEGDDGVVIYPGLKGGVVVYDLDGTPVTETPNYRQDYSLPLLVADLLGQGRDQLVVANEGYLDVYAVGGEPGIRFSDAAKSPWPRVRLAPIYSVSIPAEYDEKVGPRVTVEQAGNVWLISEFRWAGSSAEQYRSTVLSGKRITYTFNASRAFLVDSGAGVRLGIRNYDNGRVKVADLYGKTLWERDFGREFSGSVSADSSRNLIRVIYRPDRSSPTSQVIYLDANGRTVEEHTYGPKDYPRVTSKTFTFTDPQTGQPISLRRDGGVYDAPGKLLYQSPIAPSFVNSSPIAGTDRFWCICGGSGFLMADLRGVVYETWKGYGWWSIGKSLALPRPGGNPLTLMVGTGGASASTDDVIYQLMILDGEKPYGQIVLDQPALDIKVGDQDEDGESEVLLLTIGPDKKSLILTGYRIEK